MFIGKKFVKCLQECPKDKTLQECYNETVESMKEKKVCQAVSEGPQTNGIDFLELDECTIFSSLR